MTAQLPEDGLVRLTQIIGDPRKGIPALIPIGRSTWWAGVKSGRYPQPVRHLGPGVTCWKVADIRELIEGPTR